MEQINVSKKVTAARPVDACTARTILSMSLLTVMPLLSAALYLGQFLSPLIVMPLSKTLFGSDLTAPYKVGIMLCFVFIIQVWSTRHFQSLPPEETVTPRTA